MNPVSLGKTLWVLATDQRFRQRDTSRRVHGGSRSATSVLIRIRVPSTEWVDLMTRIHPEERPSKEQVARDLAVWQDLASEPVVLDVSEARARLRDKLEPQMAEQDTLEQRKDLAYAAVCRLQKLTAPLNEALKNLYGRTQVDSATDELTQNIVRSQPVWGQDIQFRWQRCTLVAPMGRPVSMTLRMSRCLELVEDGSLRLHLLVLVGPEGVFGTEFSWQADTRSAPVGSVEAEQMLEEGVRDLADALAKALDVFVDRLPDANPPAKPRARRRSGSAPASASRRGLSRVHRDGTGSRRAAGPSASVSGSSSSGSSYSMLAADEPARVPADAIHVLAEVCELGPRTWRWTMFRASAAACARVSQDPAGAWTPAVGAEVSGVIGATASASSSSLVGSHLNSRSHVGHPRRRKPSESTGGHGQCYLVIAHGHQWYVRGCDASTGDLGSWPGGGPRRSR